MLAYGLLPVCCKSCLNIGQGVSASWAKSEVVLKIEGKINAIINGVKNMEYFFSIKTFLFRKTVLLKSNPETGRVERL